MNINIFTNFTNIIFFIKIKVYNNNNNNIILEFYCLLFITIWQIIIIHNL